MKPIAPPRDVFETCARGLAARLRHNVGGTAAAVQFAELVVDGFPLDATHAAEALEAHRMLDAAVLNRGGESRELAISRNLWGGDAGRDHAEAVIEAARVLHLASSPAPSPAIATNVGTLSVDVADAGEVQTPEPMAAAGPTIDLAWLGDIEAKLARLNESTVAAIHAAMEQAKLAALRKLSSQARRAFARGGAIRASAEGDAVFEIMNQAGMHGAWFALPVPMLAELTLDGVEIVQSIVDDLIANIERILARSRTVEVAEIAAAVEVEEVVEPPEDSIAIAGAFVGFAFGAWLQTLLNRRDDDPLELVETAVPMRIAISATQAAGGAAPIGATVATNPAGIAIAADGSTVASSGARILGDTLTREAATPTPGSRIDDIAKALPRTAVDTLDALGPAEILVATRYRWHYGSPATRSQPYPPHVALERKTWVTEDERQAAVSDYYPGDHPHCQCEISETPILIVNGIEYESD